MREDSKRGCTRHVTDEDAAKYQHYREEVIPFIKMNKNVEGRANLYNEIISFFARIYQQPIGRKLDDKGKAVKFSV